MAISEEDIHKVRELTDAVAVIGQHTSLKRTGRRWVGLCPFHGERTPSFSVNAEEGLYYCFGCNASGDVIRFVQEIEGLDFPGAVELLASRAGVVLQRTDPAESERHRRRSRLLDLVDEVTDWYHDRLMNGPDAGAARAYLRSRGYDGELVRHYRLGWAPDDWDALSVAFSSRRELLIEAGLAFRNRRGRLQDSFRARVLFPICDVTGRPVAFGGRVLPGADGPKYKNSPQGPLYDKSRVLYGLNWAKGAAVATGRVVICEGYTDAIGMHRSGVPEAVATCGTSLTEAHVRLLTRFARRLVLAFDADSAGQGAAARVYEWERTHDIEVSVVELDEGTDPGELALHDPTSLAAAVDEARPFLGWRLERALAAGSLDSPEGRARTAESALAVIAEHPNPLVRDQYLMRVAEASGLPSEALRERLGAGPSASPRPASSPRSRRLQGSAAEWEALALLAHRPLEARGWVRPSLFTTPVMQAAALALLGADSIHEAIAGAEEPTLGVLSKLAVTETEAEVLDVVRVLVRRTALEIRDRRIKELSGTPAWRDEAPLLVWLAERVDELGDEHTASGATEALLGWLDSYRDPLLDQAS